MQFTATTAVVGKIMAYETCGIPKILIRTRHWLPQTYSALDTPWNFRDATVAPQCSRTSLVGPVPNGCWRLSRTNRRYGQNLGWLIRTKLETSIKWMEASHPKKVRPTQCGVKAMFIMAYDINVGLPFVLIFPDMSSFSRVILASGRNFQNQRKCPEIGLKHFNFYFRATPGVKKELQS